ncbi:metacaspase-9 [Ricinus communis]|uniref:Caspase, putative n=1 Tax=Ricinus communis TaxID=3988 RepID=B9RUK7_RICCO|nr:metacaspase-9 [Ricinus communis]EEF44994.1 caspase, putative [Ricinus communis]|eukprot:XP_002517452.1 metacaspase-9 [Ricinus communis]
MEKGKKRMAVLVGCNYPNSRNELHGCINDVVTMRDVLVKRFGFDLSHIELLTDAPAPGSSQIMPTGANIKKALDQMVGKAESGDVLLFHYSGHGTKIPSKRPGHPFRQDEAIVPCDFNLITDVDFRQLVNRLPKGTSFTIISDSCHSGGLIDKEKEQIGPNSTITANAENLSSHIHTPKHIPFNSILQHFSSLTGINTSDIGTHLLEYFGADASLKFRLQSLEQDLFESLKPDDGILLSGCQANETSADMNPGGEGRGQAYGAFSNAVQMVLKENPDQIFSNREVVMMARKVLEAQGFEQHPCLYCSDKNADAAFLWQPEKDRPC